MKSLLRRWLGYDEAAAEVSLRLLAVQEEILRLRNDVVTPLNTLATLLMSEHSAVRQELSDRLGRKVLNQLKTEDLARRHTLGEV